MALTWKTETDDSKNTYYTAETAVLDEDGLDILSDWLVTQKFERNHTFWSVEESSADLVDADDEFREFTSAEAAKLWCETREAELLAKETP